MSVESPVGEIFLSKFKETVIELQGMRVSRDIDWVEINSAVCAINKFNLRFGTQHKITEMENYWNMTEWVRQELPEISENDARAIAIELWNSPDVMEKAPLASGVGLYEDYRRELGLEDLDFRFTSRPSHLTNITRTWYQNYLPLVDQCRIYVQQSTDRIRHDWTPGKYKTEMIKAHRIQLHFDDSWEEAEAIVANTDARVVLVPAPWNRNYVSHNPKILQPTATFAWDQPTWIALTVDLYGRL